MIRQFLLLCIFLISVGCNLRGFEEGAIRVSASIEQIDAAGIRKEEPVEISSNAGVRKKQFVHFSEVLRDSWDGEESSTLKVTMTFCRTHPHELPKVGGPGATAQSSYTVRRATDGSVELLFSGNGEVPTQVKASTEVDEPNNVLSTFAAKDLERAYRNITLDAG